MLIKILDFVNILFLSNHLVLYVNREGEEKKIWAELKNPVLDFLW